MVAIEFSAWVIVDLKHSNDAQALINQKLIIYQRHNSRKLIVFRPIVKTSSTERVFEVKGARHIDEFEVIRTRLSADGVTILSEDPPPGVWVSSYSERVVWKVRVPSSTYQIPTDLQLARGHLQLLPSPVCTFCHSDDHHQVRCRWHAYFTGA